MFTSDELVHSRDALLRVYGIREEMPKGPRQRGRPRKPKIRSPPGLRYAQVVKRRRKGSVVSITTKLIFGKEQAVKKLVEGIPGEQKYQHLLHRASQSDPETTITEMGRKTNGFSKDISRLEAQLYLALAFTDLLSPN